MEKNSEKEKMDAKKNIEKTPTCGIIMPISSIDGCTENHWKDVLGIISEAIIEAEYKPNIVSLSDDVAVIQKNIVQNIYENPIIVCDVSAKNPNVMFELGMRLAFDKPTIIIKDDTTSYSFDTSPIEHLTYPRDLRFTRIIEFKKSLTEKIKATMEKAKSDKHYSPFLGSFGKFTVAKVETTEVSKEDYILEELKEMKRLFLYKENRSVNAIILSEKDKARKTSNSFHEIHSALAPIIDSIVEEHYSFLKDINDNQRRNCIMETIENSPKIPLIFLSDRIEDKESILAIVNGKIFEHFSNR